ncbi:hypothetical protein J3Q64DRAFT_1124875 [Phycomyces blakesleeanus]|uniref:Uncharacterized protein n=2 Tax=Phycomyces blakesleeanus TaxID=4837 RepID=A0A167MA94_PHYB8|nr:hypothetical protein PHYBLDRAFT_146462 [Phycomyces blakesleeanus NRRL 1555(-)]OAD72259.1 hypothetical protein PHYBLDRAFT_146462 [Phycomyces blakesleeanus NRRL 1555(-)]|eukprot:XP_018290299.1 hypothetical protein PHYBLDRAFT_146462 [Phycomyces blakesleeanus NRRL 1555(-)]
MYPFQTNATPFYYPSNEIEYMDIVDDSYENHVNSQLSGINYTKSESANDDDVKMKETRARRQQRQYTEEEVLLVCKLYYVDKLSIEESGKAVGMPKSTAGGIIRRQRDKLGLPARRTPQKIQEATTKTTTGGGVKSFDDILTDKLKIMLYDKEHPKTSK